MTTLTLHHGDCLEVLKTIPDKSIDLLICDLPFGVLSVKKNNGLPAENYGKSRISACPWDKKIDLEPFWEQVRRVRKTDASPCLHFATSRFAFELIESNKKEFRYDLIWDKGRGVSFLSANKMPMRSHETILVFSKAGAFYNRVDITGDFKPSVGGGKGSKVYSLSEEKAQTGTGSTTKRCPVSVIFVPNASKRGQHPTEKPSDLYKWLIERYCPPEGTVLDPTAGSFNSVFTAFALGRSGIGIEKDDTFYKKAEERLEALP
jgi:site-specific DNA-methyltransferase (adenine-specific)